MSRQIAGIGLPIGAQQLAPAPLNTVDGIWTWFSPGIDIPERTNQRYGE